MTCFKIWVRVGEINVRVKVKHLGKEGPDLEKVYSFKKDFHPTIDFGRSRSNDVQLRDASVSSSQFSLVYSKKESCWTAIPRGSRGATCHPKKVEDLPFDPGPRQASEARNPMWVLLEGDCRLTAGLQFMLDRRKFVVKTGTMI